VSHLLTLLMPDYCTACTSMYCIVLQAGGLIMSRNDLRYIVILQQVQATTLRITAVAAALVAVVLTLRFRAFG
jgi:hypothetical protein